MNGDIEATATLEVGTDAVEHSGCHGQHRDDRDAFRGRCYTDTTKELYVNGDIEATATLVWGGARRCPIPSTCLESPPSATL